MPSAAYPLRREFYVYRLQVGNAPFYVGIGRAGRAPDRVPHVRRMMRRQRKGNAVKWSPHTRVIARLLRVELEIREVRVLEGINRKAALVRERAEITRLVRRGALLANVQHNPNRDVAPQVIARIVINAQGVRRPGVSRKISALQPLRRPECRAQGPAQSTPMI
jgi:hypothetical protein